MRLVRFGPRGYEQTGVVIDDEIVPLAPLFATTAPAINDLESLIAVFDAWRDRIEAFARKTLERLPLKSTRLGAPLVRPGKIVGVGANYRSADGAPPAGPADPILFLKPASSIAGPTDPIALPYEATTVVGEVELVLVIGKPGRRIAPADAMAHVFGFTIANDVTAPEIMLGSSDRSPLFLQQGRGKGFPGFCPLGPAIVTADEIRDWRELLLEQVVNGVPQLSGHARLMVHDPATLVSEVSHAFGLEPGDIILSGSPRPPQGTRRQPLLAGDTLRSRIQGIGELRNPVVAEDGPAGNIGPISRADKTSTEY
jgi:2,4-diketo-3-deoxy-L-fuconate hydrolase